MIRRDLKILLKKAVKKFYDSDGALAERGGMEQACVFRIGLYLNEVLNNHPNLKILNLDCEYNRSSRGLKQLGNKRVRPDLIIHQRNFDPDNPNDNNMLIAEFKGWWNKDISSDLNKLDKFTSCIYGYEYKLGVFVHLGKNLEETQYIYSIKGRRVNENEV